MKRVGFPPKSQPNLNLSYVSNIHIASSSRPSHLNIKHTMPANLGDIAVAHAREIGALVVLLALAAVFLVQNCKPKLDSSFVLT
jgi:hypothetical protein